MNKTAMTIVSTLVLSVVAFLLMRYVLGWEQKKSMIIAFGAAAGMLLVDVVILGLMRRKM